MRKTFSKLSPEEYQLVDKITVPSRINLHYGNTCLANLICSDFKFGVILEFLYFCMGLVFMKKKTMERRYQNVVLVETLS